MALPYYKREFLKSLNDPEYAGQKVFNNILESSVIVSTYLPLKTLREGYYLLHINKYGYVGLGPRSRQGVIGYVLVKRPIYLPNEEDIGDFKFVLIDQKSTTNEDRLIILQPNEDLDTHWLYVNQCSFFMSYCSFGLDFYNSVKAYTESDNIEHTHDLLGNRITHWKDIFKRHEQLDQLVTWACHNAQVGSRTYGTKRRSSLKQTEVNIAKYRMKRYKNTYIAHSDKYATSNTMVSYFLRVLDDGIHFNDVKNAKEVIELMYENLYCIKYDEDAKKVELDHGLIPEKFTVEAVKEFRAKFIELYLQKAVKDLFLDL